MVVCPSPRYPSPNPAEWAAAQVPCVYTSTVAKMRMSDGGPLSVRNWFGCCSCWRCSTDCGVDCSAVPDNIGMRRDELLERRVDLVEVDIGDEAVDSGIDAGRLRPVQIAVGRYQVRQHL